MNGNSESSSWWASLKHGGLLIAPTKLVEFFPEPAPPLPVWLEDRLRSNVARADSGADGLAGLLDTVLEDVLGLGRTQQPETGRWLKGAHVPAEWTQRAVTGEAIKPRRVWLGANGAVLPVFVDEAPRVGLGRGRKTAARVVEWLRKSDRRIAVITNAAQWCIVYAGLDAEAFAEADTALWFEEGKAGPQVTALRTLLNVETLTPAKEGDHFPLLAAIEASRKGQAELSSVLGERVRQAVELLIQEVFRSVPDADVPSPEHWRSVYLAATRVVMRMVVILFAEARDLLPRDNPVYHASYGLQGLREMLDAVGGDAGSERLRHRTAAWPRLLSLFRLVYSGSPHEALPVPRYGGGLFEPGDRASTDAVSRALAVFEDPEHEPNDLVVHRIIELLCRSPIRVRQGSSSISIDAPVDFSDLSSEYIGILYEGLLDYELRRAEVNDPIVFLNLGDQPALPLSRLEAMSDDALPELVKKFKVKKKVAVAGDDEEENTEDTDETEEGESEDDADGEPDEAVAAQTEAPVTEDDVHRATYERALRWAQRAVVLGGLVPKPRSRKAEALRAHAVAVEQAAPGLVARVILPGEWFLVRWGGTRKGAGTFYTRPQLAVPTVQRTLRPLAYDPPPAPDGQPNENAPGSDWSPKRPDDILRLRVCDPAMGSGSFLVASLRFLTDALFASLHSHGRIQAHGEATLVTLAEGRASERNLAEETLPCRPDADDFEARLRARLKRYVVERCIYGVDLDPLAVELGRLALWVETLDRDLPFEFLDHKLKPGNALIGCWFDYFRDYPALAWEREGGDKNHSNGVHFEKEAWTRAIKACRNERIKSELADWISGQRSLLETIDGHSPEALHDEAFALLDELHRMPITDADARSAFYRERIAGNARLRRLREAFDTWCAIWFWPADRLEHAPTPRTFETPTDATHAVIQQLRQHHRFFHWELEFPDVFCGAVSFPTPDTRHPTPVLSGFDAVVGNPPWEIQKPSSKEFFSNFDPLYRTYGKQEAVQKQREVFRARAEDEHAWLQYNAHFKATANWNQNAALPFGDPDEDGARFTFSRSPKENDRFHSVWRRKRDSRSGYADRKHPYRHQGSADINTYKMFLEQSHCLLHNGGQLGMIVPSGVYTDKGSTDLRRLFLECCRWRWLFGFENRLRIFPDIDSRFKFGPIIVEKGVSPETSGESAAAISTAFMRHELNDWVEADRLALSYPHAQVHELSPSALSFLEIRSARDLELLSLLQRYSFPFSSSEAWSVRYSREFHMGDDVGRFEPTSRFAAAGFVEGSCGLWVSPDGTSAWPFLEGRGIDQFRCFAKRWCSGKGRGAVWKEVEPGDRAPGTQYLMAEAEFVDSEQFRRGHKIGVMDVTAATNERTVIASLLPACPTGHSITTVQLNPPDLWLTAAVTAVLNSYVFDHAVRLRLGGNHLSGFVMADTPIPHRALKESSIGTLALRLNGVHPLFAPTWLEGRRRSSKLSNAHPLWAVTFHERLRLRCILDAVVGELYGLDCEGLAWILRDCDRPKEQLGDKAFYRTLDPKGFWRVDKDKDPELRHTVLTLAAFRDLKQLIADCGGDRDRAIELFCGEGVRCRVSGVREGRGDAPVALNTRYPEPSSAPETRNPTPPLKPGTRNLTPEGWMLPETLCLADLGLGHDDRARQPQPVRTRLGPRFFDWQLEQSVEDSWRECEIHARNILGARGYRELLTGSEADSHTQTVTRVSSSPVKPADPQGRLFE